MSKVFFRRKIGYFPQKAVALFFAATMGIWGYAETPAKTTEDKEIRVQLATNDSLSFVYIAKLEADSHSFDASYLCELENILHFDMNYNGATHVVQRSFPKEEILQKKNEKEAFHPQVWKSFGIPYVIKWKISQKSLSLTLFSCQSGSLKYFSDIALTGDIKQDRRQVHRVADGIYKALFNKNGVANTRILYCAQFPVKKGDTKQEEWISEVWECDWDGANSRQVTREKSYCITPVFLPVDSPYATDRFLYVSYKSKSGIPRIYASSLKEGKGKQLISLPGNQFHPAISPKRDKIAFTCDREGRQDLFIQGFNLNVGVVGKPVQLFAFPNSWQASPSFSPEGDKIAFVSNKDKALRIYIISSTPSSKRSNPTLITKQNRENSCPAWAPDGTKLAYSAKTEGIRQIWIYDFASRTERQLTYGPGNKENPTWALDSLHLVFNSTDASSSDLYLVNLNQPEAIKITRGPGKKHYPAWGTR